MKIETGVMVMKNGKAWGIDYADGQCTSYGWIAPEDAPIHNPEYCKTPTSLTHKGSIYIEELATAELVPVERRTEVIIKTANAKLPGDPQPHRGASSEQSERG